MSVTMFAIRMATVLSLVGSRVHRGAIHRHNRLTSVNAREFPEGVLRRKSDRALLTLTVAVGRRIDDTFALHYVNAAKNTDSMTFDI